MHENILADAARLSDEALHERIETLAGRERDATAQLVAYLSELEGRKSHLPEGPGSLYVYCRDVLHLSEDAAWTRAAAANAVRRYPVILDWLMDGSLNVTTVRILRPVLTAENHLAVLKEARHRSKAEVERIAVRINPNPDVPSTVRKLPAPAPVPVLVSGPAASRPLVIAHGDPPPPRATPPTHRPLIVPLAPERYRVQVTISQETHDKLRRLQDLLCREIPNGDPAAILDRALDVLLAEVEKKKRAATEKPRPPRGTREDSRAIPAHVERAVWKRDGTQCAFVGKRGRCKETRFLELHHIHPYGHQGPATIDNISVRCRAHNVYESELVFGPFDPHVVRETREKYVVSGGITPVPERRLTSSGRSRWAARSA